MDRETTRRGALAGVLGAGVAGGFLSPVSTYLRQFAPLSGTVWKPARRTGYQSTVESPHGPAEIRYDDTGVPHISADDERALYFAAGYAQGADRLFQLDLQRRLTSGRLSEVVGEVTLDSDEFHRKLKFREAAEATVDHLRGTTVEPLLEAFADGVDEARQQEVLPLEFALLDYEPEPWTLADSIVVEKLIAWGLTGDFRTLRRERVREEFGDERAAELYPEAFANVDPVVRDHHDVGEFGSGLTDRTATGGPLGAALTDRLSTFEPPRATGSNSWVVDADLAGGDAPIVSNDPHLQLQSPPIWYEMHLDGPAHRVRGVTFPGVPFVIIGENDHGAWGFTNAGADVIDFYTYEGAGNGDAETGAGEDTADGSDDYRYRGERREFEVEEQVIAVDGEDDEVIEVRSSVHGPVIEESGYEVGIAWTGHAATETTLGIYELTHSESADEAVAAMSRFEAPTQNFVYGNRDGETHYHMAGRLPIRRIDGDPVRGDQLFDGSAGEGEWGGFEPFGRPTAWDEDDQPHFVPFAENPHVENPSYLATANQRIVDQERLGYYLGTSFASPYRGSRIYDLLDRQIESGDPLDLSFLREVGRDTVDGRAEALLDPLVEATRAADDSELNAAAATLAEWDRQMDPDSEAALLFDYWFEAYRDEILSGAFEEVELDEEYYPPAAAIVQLLPDSRWFDPGGRAVAMRRALRTALDDIDEDGHDEYGDAATTAAIEHPLGLSFLGYPDHPRGGSGDTVQNYSYRGPWGGSWEMQVDLDGEYLAMLPGGNSGRYFSPHYDDQIADWADGEYRSLSRDIEDDLTVTIEVVEG